MTILVTGASGQVGGFLTAELRQQGQTVVAFDRVVPDGAGADSVQGDLLDAETLTGLLASRCWNAIYHLAGVNALATPMDNYRVNVIGTATLLEAVRALGRPELPVLLMSSSAVYGAAPSDPVDENCPLAPVGHYGVSKMAIEAMARVLAAQTGQHILIARPFNIIGPGQRAALLHVRVAKQLARIAQGEQKAAITTGPLEDFRDFIDARDVARALTVIVAFGKPGEAYNICSGVAVQARELVDSLVTQSGLSVDLQVDESYRGKNSIAFQRGTADKLFRTSGWSPQVTLKASLGDTLAELGALASGPKPAEKGPDSRGTA